MATHAPPEVRQRRPPPLVLASESEVATAPTMPAALPQELQAPAAWADAALVGGALWLCGLVVPVLGHEVACCGAVTACVVTGPQTDLVGREARKKAVQRLLGTLAGIECSILCGPSWACLACWGALLMLLRQQLDGSWTYACLVATMTYAIAALGSGPDPVIWQRSLRRVVGVAVGVASMLLCLLCRVVVVGAWEVVAGLRVSEKPRAL